VTFVASVTPTTNWTLSGWTWTPDSGTGGISPSECQPSEKTCTRTISKSGWMIASTVIGSFTLSDSVHVQVISCPTGRAPLDDPAVRSALKSAYAQSTGTGLEVVLAVFRNADLGYFIQPVPTTYASQCKAVWTPPHPSSFPDDDLIAIVHTHPYKVNAPQWCPEFGSYLGGQGGSVDDWKSFGTLQQNPDYQSAGWGDLEYWVINGDYVHVMEPGKKQGSENRTGTTRFPWNSGSCHW
jgi:hypothetical protein